GRIPPDRKETADANAALHGFASSCGRRPRAARWLSRWLLTDTYSPSAIDTAPPIKAASPAIRMGPLLAVAPATPTTIAATETMPSFAPSTPARSQFARRVAAPPSSTATVAASSVTELMPPCCSPPGAAASKARRPFPPLWRRSEGTDAVARAAHRLDQVPLGLAADRVHVGVDGARPGVRIEHPAEDGLPRERPLRLRGQQLEQRRL